MQGRVEQDRAGQDRAGQVAANRDADAGERAADEIADATGAETLHVTTDVTVEDDVVEAVAATVETFGDVDVLVNNAGTSIHAPAEEMTLEEWQAVLDVDLTGSSTARSTPAGG